MKKALLLLSLIMVPVVAAADQVFDHYTRIHLSASAEKNLTNDEAVVVYRIEATGHDASRMRQQVNQASRKIHDRLSKHSDLKLLTLDRRMDVQWRYDKTQGKQVHDGWRLQQCEQVISAQPDQISEWLGAIEANGAFLDRLDFRPSETTLKLAQELLRLQAVKNFRQQAASLAKAMDATSFFVETLTTQQQLPVQPAHRAMPEVALMRTADATPDVKSGEANISVTVSGTVLLPAINYSAR